MITALVCFLAALYYQSYALRGRVWERTLELHMAFVNGTAETPYAHRVLIPALVDALTQHEEHIPLVYFGLDIVLLCVGLILLRYWLGLWVPSERAQFGMLLIGALFPLMYRDYIYSTGTSLEWVLMIAGLCCIWHLGRWSFLPR